MYYNRTKRIVAINDISGIGRVSLSVVIPVLTTMGFQVNPLPTAILSNHTQYPDFSFLDLSDEMEKIIDKWKRIGVEFDAFYSGYLGSPKQAGIVKKFIEDFRRDNDLIVVDPVLGDNGRFYTGFNQTMVTEMRRLIRVTDVVTPNLTEFFFLLGLPYKKDNSTEEMKEMMEKLSDGGPQIVVVTNVPVMGDPHRTAVYAYNRRGGRFWRIITPYLPGHYPGIGDTFTSVLIGALMQAESLPVALDRAAQFCYQAIRATFTYSYELKEGVVIEKVLQHLKTPIQITSYEVI